MSPSTRTVSVVLTGCAVGALALTGPAPAHPAAPAASPAAHPPVAAGAARAPVGTVHLPDLQTVVPTDQFSIVLTASGPEFRYTHLVVNRGDGPLQLRPSYRKSAGTYVGRQELLSHDEAGTWSPGLTRRVADAFFFHAEHGHFHFPLASFGLYAVAADGGFGPAVVRSPKNGFCIADSYLYDDTLEHSGVGQGRWGDCADPTTLRGIAVGGADEYDYRDPGQAAPIPGLRDGTYWFRAVSDPNNDVLESDETNNEVAIQVTIADGTVTPGATRRPDTTPCTTSIRTPEEGDRVSGSVRLTAATSLPRPTRVRYLVDGRVVGSSTGAAPYAVPWRSDTVVDGPHWLASRATGGDGRACTSRVVGVDVDNAHGADTLGPLVRFTDPSARATVGGRVAVAASAADASGVDRVQFLLDGRRLGAERTHPPYTLVWNSRTARPGRHLLGARATDRRGNVATRRIGVRVRYVPPPLPLSVDASVADRGTGTLTTPAFSTHTARQVLLATVSYDGPEAADGQSARVSGAGLGWTLVKRSSSQAGVSEIWAARTRTRLTGRVVRAVPEVDGYDGLLSLFSFRNAARTGVAAAAGAPDGAPSFYLPAVQEGSWVFAAGNDWDAAVSRVPVGRQGLRRQWLDQAADNTFWVQAPGRPTVAQRLVTIADTAPTADRWNYVGVEVVARH